MLCYAMLCYALLYSALSCRTAVSSLMHSVLYDRYCIAAIYCTSLIYMNSALFFITSLRYFFRSRMIFRTLFYWYHQSARIERNCISIKRSHADGDSKIVSNITQNTSHFLSGYLNLLIVLFLPFFHSYFFLPTALSSSPMLCYSLLISIYLILPHTLHVFPLLTCLSTHNHPFPPPSLPSLLCHTIHITILG